MAGVQTFPQSNQFNIDNVSISLTPQEFSDTNIIRIVCNGNQFILEYRALRANVSEQEANQLNSALGIKIV